MDEKQLEQALEHDAVVPQEHRTGEPLSPEAERLLEAGLEDASAGRAAPVPPPALETVSSAVANLGQSAADAQAEAAILREQRDRLEVQLAAVTVAAMGHAKGDNSVAPGAYGWSAAFADVLKLRAEVEDLRAQKQPRVVAETTGDEIAAGEVLLTVRTDPYRTTFATWLGPDEAEQLGRGLLAAAERARAVARDRGGG